MDEIKQALIEAGVLTETEGHLILAKPEALYTESAKPQLEFIANELVRQFAEEGVRTVVAMEKKRVLAHAVTKALNNLTKDLKGSKAVAACTVLAEKRPGQFKVLIQNHWQSGIKDQTVLIVHDFLMNPLEMLMIQELVEAVINGGGNPRVLCVIAGGDRRFGEIFRMSTQHAYQLLDHRDLAMK